MTTKPTAGPGMPVRRPLEVLDAGFFTDHWRRKPVVFRGAAGSFLRQRPTRTEVKALTSGTGEVKTDGRTIWFLESLTDTVSGVAGMCADARAAFEWDDVWCDVFLTEGSSSIGAHIDDSDNFTVQLEGTKRWRLGSPDTLSVRQRRLRLLGEPDAGDSHITDDCAEFTLQPGDVLYIPLLWRHWGVSHGDSLSISLVVNSRSVWHALHGVLTDELRRDARWWDPVEIGPGTGPRRRAQLDGALTALDMSEAIGRTRKRAVREVAEHTGTKTAERLYVDMEWVRGFIGSAPQPPRSDLVLPGPATEALNSLLARKNLKDLLKLVVTRFGQTTATAERELYRATLDALTAQDAATLERVLTGPDVTSWIAVAKLGPAELPVRRREDTLAHQLAFFLLPELAGRADRLVPALRVDADRTGGLALPRLGLAASTVSASGSWQVTVGPDGPRLDAGDGRDVPPSRKLERIADGPVVVEHPSAWLDEHLPPTEVLPTAAPADVERFRRDFGDAADLLREVWPQVWDEIVACVERLVPMPFAGLRPHNYSVHAFRGLIVSSPRPAVMAAQTLVHETGHHRMSTIIDLLPLCTNPTDRAISPVVNADRPLTAVFHGCYSFAREVQLTRMLIERGIPSVPATDMGRYLAERATIVRAAWEVLRDRADLLPAGEAIMTEVSEILDRTGC
ncbi:HEXXH motif-containing putative peptide modification protein [Streptomyces sp. NPDC056716]|uniref:aKG-HExxH-type peptide beta-hydroxylase n=1 Tax=unclassified Streptomyces TaxID=2593676 RepID=UPI003691B697